jgi:CheY-like chemotaxis protein
MSTPTLTGDPAPRGRPRLLVADDNQVTADSLAELLTSWAYEVQVAYDGLEALRVAQRWHPDGALLDLGLPGLDGYQVALRLREQAGPHSLVLIAVTGFDWKGAARRSQEYGFDHHLVKPIDPEQLRQLLEQRTRPPAVAEGREPSGTAPPPL